MTTFHPLLFAFLLRDLLFIVGITSLVPFGDLWHRSSFLYFLNNARHTSFLLMLFLFLLFLILFFFLWFAGLRLG